MNVFGTVPPTYGRESFRFPCVPDRFGPSVSKIVKAFTIITSYDVHVHVLEIFRMDTLFWDKFISIVAKHSFPLILFRGAAA